MFIRTTAINKILAMKARIKVIQGGSSAGKTFGILPVLIDKAARMPGREISVVSESIPHLKRGALKDFIKIMKWTRRWVDERYNATDRKYTFGNGSYIEFFSPESILGSRRTDLYMNECNFNSYEDYHQLSIRTSGEIWLDFNPSEEFWVHTEVLTGNDAELLILTYKDNEGLPQNVVADFDNARKKAIKEAEQGIKGYWTNWCKVYIDGELGSLQGTVFSFNQVDAVPETAKLIAYGLDFGFSNDPTALVAVYKHDGAIILDEIIYKTGLTNTDLMAEMASCGVPKNESIIADSAEPKSIEDLRRGGYSVAPAKKGADSIRNSIDTLQAVEIKITKRSTNLIREFRLYRWETDKGGKALDKPIDAYNHGIDAVRYVALNKINKGWDNFDYSFVFS